MGNNKILDIDPITNSNYAVTITEMGEALPAMEVTGIEDEIVQMKIREGGSKFEENVTTQNVIFTDIEITFAVREALDKMEEWYQKCHPLNKDLGMAGEFEAGLAKNNRKNITIKWLDAADGQKMKAFIEDAKPVKRTVADSKGDDTDTPLTRKYTFKHRGFRISA